MKFSKFVGLIVLSLGLYLLWRIRFVVLLAFSAVALSTVLNRVVRQLVRWRIKRRFAVIITLVGVTALIGLIIAIALPPFINQVGQWLDRVPTDVNRISRIIREIDSRLPAELALQLQKLEMFIRDIPRFLSGFFNNFFLFLRGGLSLLLNVFFVLAVTIMLLATPKAYRRSFVMLFPHFYRRRTQTILDECEKALVGWGVGILFNMVTITVLSFVGLALIDVPLPIANAFIAGILTFIPNVGPVLSVIPPALLGLLEAPWKGAAVIVLYIIIQQAESNLLTPLVMKHQVSLLPAVTLICQLMLGVLFGFMGLFLALPIIVTGQVWLRELLIKDVMNNWREQD